MIVVWFYPNVNIPDVHFNKAFYIFESLDNRPNRPYLSVTGVDVGS